MGEMEFREISALPKVIPKVIPIVWMGPGGNLLLGLFTPSLALLPPHGPEVGTAGNILSLSQSSLQKELLPPHFRGEEARDQTRKVTGRRSHGRAKGQTQAGGLQSQTSFQ